MCLTENAQQVLHVVTHFMGDDVGIREVAVSTNLALHGGEETQVDVEFLVARAIEWSYCRRCCTAGRVDAVGKEHQRGRRILATHLLEHLAPNVLGGCQHLARELSELLLLFRELTLAVHLLFLHLSETTLLDYVSYYIAEIASAQECEQGNQQNTAKAADTGFSRRRHTAAILDVLAFSSSV